MVKSIGINPLQKDPDSEVFYLSLMNLLIYRKTLFYLIRGAFFIEIIYTIAHLYIFYILYS